MILLAFACGCALVAAGAARLAWRGPVAEARALSGIGDEAFYSGGLSENDFFDPALVFDDAPRGLYRRTVNPVHRDDAKMKRMGLERSGKHFVYTDFNSSGTSGSGAPPRWYLKAGTNRYVEFGTRKFFESFSAPKKP